MSMYGYDVSFYDYGFSDPAITSSLYGNSVSPMAAAIDYDDGVYVRRRPPPRPTKTPSSPSKHRHDGTSPLPLGMDWSLPPRIWEGRNSVWPHDSRKGWSYCVTVPSWTIIPSDSGSDTVFFRVQVGILSPEGITTTRGVLRRFNEFLKLYYELRKEFPKKNLPPTPPRRLMKMRSETLLEERRCGLEGWVEKLLSDIDVSRTLLVAIFLELEAAARQSCCELNEEEESAAANLVQFPSNSGISSDLSAPRPEKENYAEPDIDNAASERENFRDNSSVNISDMEELQRKCMELELKLTIEQDARAYAESMKASAIQQNEALLKELDDAREQVEIRRKQQDEVELKSKSDVKILVKEVKSLRTSHSELKQELSKCLEEKVELEKEKQRWETENAIMMAVLQECQLLHNRLRDSSVNFLVDEENKLTVDTSLSDAINLLETSDNQISLLLAEAQLLIAEDAKTAAGAADENDIQLNRDDELRRLMGDILADNAKLRKQVTQLAINTLFKDN